MYHRFISPQTLIQIISIFRHGSHINNTEMELQAGSAEVARLEFSVVDRNGVLCPYASDELSFDLDGPIRLLGVDNGDPVDMFPYKQPRCRSFRGKCVLFPTLFSFQSTSLNVQLRPLSLVYRQPVSIKHIFP